MTLPLTYCSFTSCHPLPPITTSLLSCSLFPKPTTLLKPPHLCEIIPSCIVISFLLWETHSSFRTQPDDFWGSLNSSVTPGQPRPLVPTLLAPLGRITWYLTSSNCVPPVAGTAIPSATPCRAQGTQYKVVEHMSEVGAPCSAFRFEVLIEPRGGQSWQAPRI